MRLMLEKYPVLKKVLQEKHLRIAVQVTVALILIYAAWEFYNFVQYIRSYGFGPVPNRPPVAEGFLPIAAIVAFKAWLATGTIDPIHPAGLMIFLATITTAFLFRRALCGWICPFGTLNEFLGKIGKKLIGRSIVLPKWLDYPLLTIKYYIFFFFIFKLFFLQFPAEEAIAFMEIPYYAISDIKMMDFFLGISGTWIIILLVIAVATMFIRSFWCRYLCPYGAFLGFIGFFSPMLLTRDKDKCIDCNLCNQECPSACEVATKKYVVTPECTGCAACVNVCPKEGALQFKLLGFLPVKALYFSVAFLAVFFGIIMWAKLTGHWDTVLTIQEYKFLDSMMSGVKSKGFLE